MTLLYPSALELQRERPWAVRFFFGRRSSAAMSASSNFVAYTGNAAASPLSSFCLFAAWVSVFAVRLSGLVLLLVRECQYSSYSARAVVLRN